MKTLPVIYRTLMTMLLVSGMIILNVDAFGQCPLCGGSATGTGSVAIAGATNGINASALGTNATASANDAVAIGEATSSGLCSYSFGKKVFAKGDYSFAIGHKVQSDVNDTYNYVFGRGLSNADFINDVSNSIMLGMNSDVSTMFIEGAAGTTNSIGRVGIGTTDPDGILHIKDESTSNTYLYIEKADAKEGGIVWHNGAQPSTTTHARIAMNDQEDLYVENWQVNRDIVYRLSDGTFSEVMRIDGSAKSVGIGLSNPAQRLHVQEPAATGGEAIMQLSVSDASDEFLRFGNFNTTTAEFSGYLLGRTESITREALMLQAEVGTDPSSNLVPAMLFSTAFDGGAIANRPLFRWSNGTNVHMQMDVNGNLGIGTTAPLQKLNVVADDVTSSGEVMAQFEVSDAGTGQYLRFGSSETTDTEFAAYILGRNDGTDREALMIQAEIDTDPTNNTVPAMQFNTAHDGGAVVNRPLFRWTNGTSTHMQMIADGNLGIGTTSPIGS